MIKNNDKLLIGRDDTSYHVVLEDAGLATIEFVTNVVDNITDTTDNAQIQIDNKIEKSVLLQMIQDNNNYDDFRQALIDYLT